MDRALSDLRPQIQGKKWYWPLCINAINLLFVYSWRLYEIANNKKVEQREFRRDIVNILLNLVMEIPKGDSQGLVPAQLSISLSGMTTRDIILRASLYENPSCVEKMLEFSTSSAKKHSISHFVSKIP